MEPYLQQPAFFFARQQPQGTDFKSVPWRRSKITPEAAKHEGGNSDVNSREREN